MWEMSPTRSMMSLSFTLIWLNVLSAKTNLLWGNLECHGNRDHSFDRSSYSWSLSTVSFQLLSWWIRLVLVPKYKKIRMSNSNSKMWCKPVQIGRRVLKCHTRINSRDRIRTAHEHCWWRWLKFGDNYHSNDDYSSLGVIKARGGCVGWLNADETPQRERARARALFCVWHKDTANIFTRHNNGCKQGILHHFLSWAVINSPDVPLFLSKESNFEPCHPSHHLAHVHMWIFVLLNIQAPLP